jgi:hypothetical protein
MSAANPPVLALIAALRWLQPMPAKALSPSSALTIIDQLLELSELGDPLPRQLARKPIYGQALRIMPNQGLLLSSSSPERWVQQIDGVRAWLALRYRVIRFPDPDRPLSVAVIFQDPIARRCKWEALVLLDTIIDYQISRTYVKDWLPRPLFQKQSWPKG